jgi:hypothetical protein
VNRWSGGKKDQKGAERFFNNPKVKLSELIAASTAHCKAKQASGHILVLQDSSELNYDGLNGLLQVNDPDIGVLSDDKSTGFFIHPGLAVSASTGVPVGISSIQMWNRRFGRLTKEERKYKELPIAEKESYKWLQTAQQSEACLTAAEALTFIGDRENDVYEFFCTVPKERVNVLVRSSWNRKVSSGLLLEEELAQLDWMASVPLELKGNDKRTARLATLQVKWKRIEILKPSKQNKSLEAYPDQVSLNVVELWEHPDSVPVGEQAVHWRLFTTHPVTTLEEALQIAKWYSWRWWIEDLFRVLKTQGLEVERSQFGTGIALKKLVVLCLEEALNILLMRQERTGSGNLQASVCFTPEEQTFLEVLQPELEGNTQKQKNPHPVNSLAWAVWIIARLAGWKPADLNKRPPGVITLSRGLKIFHQRFYGWQTALTYLNKPPAQHSDFFVGGD